MGDTSRPWKNVPDLPDLKELSSAEFYQKANGGDAEAQYFMSRFLQNNAEDRLKWLKKAAENGYVRAQFDYGHTLTDIESDFYDDDEGEGTKWLRAAAENGWAPAQYELGEQMIRSLEWNDEVEPDTIREGIEWLQKAAELEYAEAQELYGKILLEGVELEGVYIFEKRESEAIPMLTRAAENGMTEAAYLLGKAYEEGRGVEKPDYSQAAKYYGITDFRSGHVSRGLLFEIGPHAEYGGPERNYKVAFVEYTQGIGPCHPEAYYHLGMLHMRGLGTPQNFAEAYINLSIAVALSNAPPDSWVSVRDEAAAKLGTPELMKAQKQAKKLVDSILDEI